jgi:tRNA nucleotidyltransferase (CCA-adding enzyme)
VLALAARAIPAGELAELLDTLAFEAPDRTGIVAAATGSAVRSEALKRAGRPSEIAAALAGAGVEEVAIAGALGAAPKAREWLDQLRHVRLEIDGADLLAAGVAEGPAVGRGLRAALAAKLDGQAQGRAAELSEALRAAR